MSACLFFKQKTAYEMRISDWSSDVCSSDLRGVPGDSATATEVDKDADEENETLTSLRLDEVHQLATGKGVGVAVIDSGISTSKTLSVRAGKSFVTGKVADGHGTIVAGVRAGRGGATGIAPGEEIYDLRVAAGPAEGAAHGPP